MSAFLLTPALAWAASTRLVMPWFVPVALALGALGTRTGSHQRRMARRNHDKGWWLIVVFAWLPLVYWILAQFVPPI